MNISQISITINLGLQQVANRRRSQNSTQRRVDMSNLTNGPVKPTTRAEFESVFPSLIDDLGQHCKQYNSPQNALQWFQDVS